jgi:catechol 2,3-dioxygenase
MNITTIGGIQDIGIHPAERLPASAHLGRVRLAVSNLEQSILFYNQVIGLAVVEQAGNLARLGPRSTGTRGAGSGVGHVLLELVEEPGVQPLVHGKRLGLYHAAFLLPTRRALGNFVRHVKVLGVPFGAGDHIYNEAIYLTDPDGLDVEVSADRDRSVWRYEGQEIVSETNPARLNELLSLADRQWTGVPEGTTLGHVHLYVGNLDEASAFYHAALGMDFVTWRFPGSLFVSAGGYHHHVGLNAWASGARQASAQDARLLHWELAFSDQKELDRTAERLRKAGYEKGTGPMGAPAFRDPWGTTVVLVRDQARVELAA